MFLRVYLLDLMGAKEKFGTHFRRDGIHDFYPVEAKDFELRIVAAFSTTKRCRNGLSPQSYFQVLIIRYK